MATLRAFIKEVKNHAKFIEKSPDEEFRLLQIPEVLFDKLAGKDLI